MGRIVRKDLLDVRMVIYASMQKETELHITVQSFWSWGWDFFGRTKSI